MFHCGAPKAQSMRSKADFFSFWTLLFLFLLSPLVKFFSLSGVKREVLSSVIKIKFYNSSKKKNLLNKSKYNLM